MWIIPHFKSEDLTPATFYVHTVRQTKFLLDKKKEKKTILLFSERYCVSVHDISNEELTIKIRRDKHNYYKDLFFFPGLHFEMYNKKREGNITAGTLSSSVKNKVSGMNLFMQLFTHHSPYLRMLLLEHCDTRLHLPLLRNNGENNYYFSLFHPHTKHQLWNLLHSKRPTDCFKKTKQQNSKWCENHEPLFLFLSKWLCEANCGDEGMTTWR